jgi:hypothetical protein
LWGQKTEVTSAILNCLSKLKKIQLLGQSLKTDFFNYHLHSVTKMRQEYRCLTPPNVHFLTCRADGTAILSEIASARQSYLGHYNPGRHLQNGKIHRKSHTVKY